MKADALWAWKSFLRSHNPILYDLGIVTGVDRPDSSLGSPSFASPFAETGPADEQESP